MKSFISPVLGAVMVSGLAVALSACGNETTPPSAPSSSITFALDEQATFGQLFAHDPTLGYFDEDDAAPSTECADIMATIHAHRKAVTETREWAHLSVTPEWQQVEEDGTVLKRLKCQRNDPNPSYGCKYMIDKIKKDFATAQQTDAYKRLTQIGVWQELERNYDEARAKHCLPSQQPSNT